MAETESYEFTKVGEPEGNPGSPTTVEPPSSHSKPRPKKWKKVGYKFNPFVDEVEPPHVILVNRRLQKIGEIVNISNFRTTLKEYNQANEISFTVNKELNGIEEPFYQRISDLAVVYTNGEFFEIGITNHEDSSIQKNVVGVSLGYAELSQILHTLQVNTDDDLIRPELDKFREKYDCGTIFYNPISQGDSDEQREWKKNTSLLDRILSMAPHYQIGYVDETLRNIKRQFSWSNTDILSILNSVGEEVGCVFDIVVTYDVDGNAVRKINAYDLNYCKYCWDAVRGGFSEFDGSADTYRDIQNGCCQNCKDTIDIVTGKIRTGAEDIVELGTDTGIFLSTDNLTDDITVDGNKDGIKTAFKLEGGDDLMTATLQGLNPSGTNKIMLYPQYMMKNFSPELYDGYEKFRKVNDVVVRPYEELLEILYDVQDAMLYLKSGKMPVFDEPITDVETAFISVIDKINLNFYDEYYIDSRANLSDYAVKTSVRKLMTTFMPKGFGVQIEVGQKYKKGSSADRFVGTITFYNTSDKDECIVVDRSVEGTTSVKAGEKKQSYNGQNENKFKEFISSIHFRFGDDNLTDYAGYIKTYCASLLSKNNIEYENDKEKDWSQYSYERLKNYYEGYDSCIDVLNSMLTSSETVYSKQVITDIVEKYARIKDHISLQMDVIKDQLFYLGSFLGQHDDMFLDSDGNLHSEYVPLSGTYYSEKDFVYSDYTWKAWVCTSPFTSESQVINHLVDRTKVRISDAYSLGYDIGDYPFKCKRCGSTNVRRTTGVPVECKNCHNHDIDSIITYHNQTQKIVDYYNSFDSYINAIAQKIADVIGGALDIQAELKKDKSLYGVRDSIQAMLDIHNFLDSQLFAELMSYERDQLYSNPNYISDGLTNEELITQAKELQSKAKRELSKACMPQYSITMTVGSIVALEPYEFMGEEYNTNLANFAINNFIHVRMDGEHYKLRIASIDLSYPMSDKISVTFTNAERYVDGFSSDIASILSNAQSMATSYNYVANQSEKGVVASNTFDYIKSKGLDTSLMAVNSGRNQDVVIDDHGILLRQLNEYTGLYDDHQTKMVNNNIVMTDDNWRTARLAIGLTLNPLWTEGVVKGDENKYLYGVYADAIVGNIIVGKRIRRVGNRDLDSDYCTVEINDHGLEMFSGLIDISDSAGNRAIINPCGIQPSQTDPNGNYLKDVSKDYIYYAAVAKPASTIGSDAEEDGCVFSIDRNGNAFFAGEIRSNKGHIANWLIRQDCLYTEENGGNIATESGMYFGKSGLRIGPDFYVDISKREAHFRGKLYTSAGKIANWNIKKDALYTSSYRGNGMYFGEKGLSMGKRFYVTPDGELHASEGVFSGVVEGKTGYIGSWTITNAGALVGDTSRNIERQPRIYTSDHPNFEASDKKTGFYIGPEGVSIGNFYIQTGSQYKGQGTMALPRARLFPFDYKKDKIAGHLQFIGSKKARNFVYSTSWDGETDKDKYDTLYLTYSLLGVHYSKASERNTDLKKVEEKLYNCLEIRKQLFDNGKNTFNDFDNKWLGKIRVDDVILGHRSLKAMLKTLSDGVYDEDDEYYDIIKSGQTAAG